MKLPWSKIWNALGYQSVWFATLFGAANGYFWLGFFCSLVFGCLMLVLGGKAKQDIRIVTIALAVGIATDTFFAASGLILYTMPWAIAGFAPLWIIALWLSFSFTLNHSMAFLRNNYLFAMLFGLFGGPLAYWCADRLFNVIEYGSSISVVMLALAIFWGLAVPGIFYIDRRFSSLLDAGKVTA